MKTDGKGESLMVRARSQKRNERQGRFKSRSKSRNERKCLYCPRAFKKDFHERKKKMVEKMTEKSDASIVVI